MDALYTLTPTTQFLDPLCLPHALGTKWNNNSYRPCRDRDQQVTTRSVVAVSAISICNSVQLWVRCQVKPRDQCVLVHLEERRAGNLRSRWTTGHGSIPPEVTDMLRGRVVVPVGVGEKRVRKMMTYVRRDAALDKRLEEGVILGEAGE